MDRKIIALAGQSWQSGRKRSTLETRTYYVKGFNYGDGDTIRRVHTTSKRDEAARFDASRAEALAATLRDPLMFGLFPTIEQA